MAPAFTGVIGRTLVLGDYSAADYHPLGVVEGPLRAVLESAGGRVESSEDRSVLDGSALTSLDLLVLCVDRWKESLGPDRAAAIATFVAAGGGLLVIHNGISAQAEGALAMGARFVGHPSRAAEVLGRTRAPTRPSGRGDRALRGAISLRA